MSITTAKGCFSPTIAAVALLCAPCRVRRVATPSGGAVIGPGAGPQWGSPTTQVTSACGRWRQRAMGV